MSEAGVCFLLLSIVHCTANQPLTRVQLNPPTTFEQATQPPPVKWNIFNASSYPELLENQLDGNAECRSIKSLNESQWCSFVKTTDDCKTDSGFIDYIKGAICGFPHNLLPLAIILYVFWLIYLFAFLGITAEHFFCPNLAAISSSLKLSHNVAGVTFLALGNGAPDVFSAVAAFSDPRTASLAIGALIGAGVFVTTVVAGSVAFTRPFLVPSRPFLRDMIFYMGAVFWTFLILYFRKIDIAQALGYLGLYLAYVVTVIICSFIYQRRKKQENASYPARESENSDSEDLAPASIRGCIQEESEYQSLIEPEEAKSTISIILNSINPIDCKKWRRKSLTWKILKCLKMPIEFVLLICIPVVDPDLESRNWKRPLNCLHIVTGPLVCVLTFKAGYYGLIYINGQFPVWLVVLLVGLILALLIFFTSKNEDPPKYHCVFSFIGFLFSAVLINTAATEIVNLLRTFGVIFNWSNIVLGLTLLAWGNSIGDLFSNTTIARKGYPRMALSACFGGIIFNMLFGIGLSSLLQMPYNNYVLTLTTDGLLDWILVGALGLSLVLSFIMIPAQGFHLRRAYGLGLICYYLIFIIIALLTEARIIHVSS
uniref:Sodium/potassium/calcium exchanger 6-like protein n=1 Tax=Callorhinchus milii TaxID=7868 RepID=V9KG07_CALMI